MTPREEMEKELGIVCAIHCLALRSHVGSDEFEQTICDMSEDYKNKFLEKWAPKDE